MENPIKTYRLARRWTQERLAEESKLSVSIVSAYERGTRTYTYKTLQPIARALGVSVADLLEKENLPLNTSELIEALLEKVAQETSSPDKKKKIQHYLELIKMELSEQE